MRYGAITTGWFAGFRACVLATVIATIIGVYQVMQGQGAASFTRLDEVRSVLFFFTTLGLGWMVDSARTARRNANERGAQLALEVIEREKIQVIEREQRQQLATEIDRRELAEVELRRREERIRMAAESSDIGIWDYAPLTDQHEWSGCSRAMFGIGPEEDVTLASFLQRVHVDDRDRVAQAVKAALDPQGEGPYNVEYRVQWPDGTVRWIVAKGQMLFKGTGAQRHAYRAVGTMRDITERKQSELALRQAENRFRVLAMHAPVGIFQTDRLGQCMFVNDKWCTIAGASSDEALGQGWANFVHPDDRQRVVTDWQAATSARRDHAISFRFLNPHAGVRSVDACATVMLDATGEIAGYVGTIVDVTERRQIEDAVRANEARLRGIIDNTTSSIYLKDLEGRYLLINSAVEQFVGLSSDQLLMRSDRELFPREAAERFHETDRRVVQTGAPVEVEEEVPREDGLHTYITVKFPIRNSAGQIVAVGGISTDITDRKLATDALKEEQELLRRTIEIQDQERQLIAYEIHDGLVQYVTGAKMQLESIAARNGSSAIDGHALAAELQTIVGILQRAVAEGRRLINGIRTPVLDDWGIMPAIEQLVDEDERAHVKVEFQNDETIGRLDPKIEEALYRIAQEALTNTRKHSKSTRIRIRLCRHEDRVRLEVRDWGIGFTPSLASKSVHGLNIMTKRARIAGGSCTIESAAPGYDRHSGVALRRARAWDDRTCLTNRRM